MSDISISSSSGGGAANIKSSASLGATPKVSASVASAPLATDRPAAGDSVSTATGLDTVRATSTTGAATSSISMTLDQVDHNRLSSLVLALIASLFGDQDKKKEKDDAAGLLGMLMLSALQPSVSKLSYTETYTSQVAQSSQTLSTNSVQATPYSAGAGASTSAAAGSASASARIDLSA